MDNKAVFALALLGMVAAGSASAAEHEVKMLNKGADGAMVFEPAVLKIQPGDSVTFVPTDKSHNAESIDGMLPAGAAPFQGKLNQPVTVVFNVPGVYGYMCKPHYAMGMVGLVVVGDAAPNLEAAKAVPQRGKAKDRFAAAFAQIAGKVAAAN